MKNFPRWMLTQCGPPLGLFLAVVVAWQLLVDGLDIKRFLLPSPYRVATAAIKDAGDLSAAVGLTAAAAVCGFAMSLLIGTGIACLFSQSRLIRSSCYPYAIFLQTVPVVAIAPLIIIWFGRGFQSVVFVAFIVSLFPVITNATIGLLSIDPDLLDLFRLYQAGRLQVLLKLRLPHSVPYLVAGAKTSAGVAVIGAIVGEFFIGYGSGRFGLGYLIRQTSELLKTDLLFAAVISSTVLGVAIFGLVSLAGATILTRWNVSAAE